MISIVDRVDPNISSIEFDLIPAIVAPPPEHKNALNGNGIPFRLKTPLAPFEHGLERCSSEVSGQIDDIPSERAQCNNSASLSQPS